MTSPVFEAIKQDIENNDVVLYMKGSADMPRCGFSMQVVQILQHLGLTFKDVNVLENQDVWQGIKEFTNWPTIPQLYIKSEFVGGCDITREMYESGELQDILKDKGISFNQAAQIMCKKAIWD